MRLLRAITGILIVEGESPPPPRSQEVSPTNVKTCVYCSKPVGYRVHYYGSGWTHVSETDESVDYVNCSPTAYTVATPNLRRRGRRRHALVKRRLFGDKPTLHVEPLDKPEGHVMAGGAFVSTSDSRWSKMIGFYGAVPLHDRVEGWKS